MSKYTAEQVSAAMMRAADYLENADGNVCLDDFEAEHIIAVLRSAATLRQNPERGVTEAMVDRVAKAIADAAGHGMREKCESQARAAIAALSAEPAAQGGAVCGYRAKNNPDCFMGPAAVAAQKAMGWDVSTDPAWVPVYTAPPAQPDGRVPEGLRLAIAHIQQKADAYAEENCGVEWDTGATVYHYGQAGEDYHHGLLELVDELTALTASPAPSEGGKGVDRGL